MNYKIILAIVLVLAAVAAWTFNANRKQNFKSVSVTEFAEIIKDTATVQLLDVRTVEEYSEGRIAGALQIDFHSTLFMDLATMKLSKEKPVAIYCRSGRRSASAAEKLVKQGYEVINLEGGILAWQSEGMPVESKQSQEKIRKVVEKRVREIYDEVYGWYLAHVDDPSENDFNDKIFFSKDYWKILSDVICADTESEEIGFFDYDHWIQAQDWDRDLALHVDSVNIIDDHHAFVHTHITNCGSKSSLIIAMLFEDGAWFIDDFIRPDFDNSSEKESMKHYIEQK
ncbi:MAG: DUF3828 domain-containing protein [Bacteroidaceae bacterium]|nr:DUF3828 domain-containing protein [Bacteroidaceae bacterium]